MAIYRLIANGAFGQQEIELMSAAYESALINLGVESELIGDQWFRYGAPKRVTWLYRSCRAAYTKGGKTRDVFASSPSLRKVLEWCTSVGLSAHKDAKRDYPLLA